MKTFEENWTAWLDGELTGDELAEFEASLPDKAAAEAEKQRRAKARHVFEGAPAVRRDGQRGVFQSSTARADRARRARRDAYAKRPAPDSLVADRPVGLGRRDIARDFFRLHLFRHARESADRPIAVSHSNSECAGRSRGKPGRDHLDVRIEGRQGDRPLGGRVAVASVRIRARSNAAMQRRSFFLLGAVRC